MTLPPPGKTAALHTPEGGQYSVVVLRHEDDHAVVGRPTGLADTPGLDAGIAADLTWSGDDGQQMITTEIVAAAATPGMSSWTLRATGHSVQIDRRAYRRVELNVPLTVGLVGQWQPIARCLLVDLSEVGMRARINRSDVEDLTSDIELTLRFGLGSDEISLLGRAIRIKAVGALTDLVDIAIIFDLTPENRHLLRSALEKVTDEEM